MRFPLKHRITNPLGYVLNQFIHVCTCNDFFFLVSATHKRTYSITFGNEHRIWKICHWSHAIWILLSMVFCVVFIVATGVTGLVGKAFKKLETQCSLYIL